MSEIPEQEDYSALPLEDRLTHKVWKVRLNAYEESTRAFTSSPDESASCFKPYNNDPDLLVKAVRDANVVAQEAGIGLLLAYLEFSGAHNAVRTRSSAVAAIVEKCLGSTRAGTKTKAIDVCLMYVELDTGEPVIEDLIPGLSNKLPKIVAATTMAMKKIYEAFGAKTVKAKPAVQVLPKLFTHADKNVRAEATELAIILYRWLGDAVKPMLLADLKPVQVKELETAFDSITIGEVKQERFLRSQQAAQASAGDDDSAAADSEVVEEEAVDAFDLAEPVDVLATLPPTFEDAMSSTKWKDRKELLEVLVSSSTVPRIKEGDYGDVARTLGKCVQKDANVVCVALAANCIENLAKGLKRSFGRYRNVIFSPCGERFKEKKQNVIDAISAALDALFLTTTLDDILEETLTLIKSKNPSVRQHMLAFLSRSLSVTPVFPKKEEVKALAEGAASLVGDADVKVREAALETLGVLMKLIGERAMGPYLEGLDDIKKAKIMEYFTSATVKAKADKIKAVAAPVVKPAVKKAPVMKKAPIGTIPNSPTKKKPVVGSGYGVTRPSLAKPTSRLTRPSEAARPESPAPASRTIRAGVTLARPTAQNLARPTTHSTSTEGNMSAADRMDLESLRREKKDWLATAVDREDLARMRQQIQELQIKVLHTIELRCMVQRLTATECRTDRGLDKGIDACKDEGCHAGQGPTRRRTGAVADAPLRARNRVAEVTTDKGPTDSGQLLGGRVAVHVAAQRLATQVAPALIEPDDVAHLDIPRCHGREGESVHLTTKGLDLLPRHDGRSPAHEFSGPGTHVARKWWWWGQGHTIVRRCQRRAELEECGRPDGETEGEDRVYEEGILVHHFVKTRETRLFSHLFSSLSIHILLHRSFVETSLTCPCILLARFLIHLIEKTHIGTDKRKEKGMVSVIVYILIRNSRPAGRFGKTRGQRCADLAKFRASSTVCQGRRGWSRRS